MRQATQRKIDELHAQIAELIEAEKLHHDRQHPGESWLHRHIAHARIEQAAESPNLRANMVVASASLPVLPAARAEAKGGDHA